MRKLGIVSVSALLATVIVLSGLASATYGNLYVTSVDLAAGTVTTGNLLSLKAKDANVYNIRETGSPLNGSTFTVVPNADLNFVNWGTNCTGYYSCVTSFLDISQFGDGNTTINWMTNPTNAQLWFGLTHVTLPTPYAGLTVTAGINVRKNSSGSPLVFLHLYDPVNYRNCGVMPLMPSMAFGISTFAFADCGGVPWTQTIIDTLQYAISSTTQNVALTVTAAWVNYTVTTGPGFQIDAYLNVTLPSNSVPYSANWTCNHTGSESFYLYVWSHLYDSYQLLVSYPCPIGAQTDSSALISPLLQVRVGNHVSFRFYNPIRVNAQAENLTIDAFVMMANTTAIPSIPSNPPGENWSWVFFLAFLLGAGILVAIYIRRWEDSR